MGFMGVQRLHPFDSEKFGKIKRYLMTHAGLEPSSFVRPDQAISEAELLIVHTKAYLESLKKSSTVARIAELKLLAFSPNLLLRKFFLAPMRYATFGTIKASELALERGWAINLSGGYHHAKRVDGDGFCFYADIPLAIRKLREKNNSLKALVIDLDAHQGNGIEDYFKDDKNSFIMDVYNREIYPEDEPMKAHIDFHFPVASGTGDNDYLSLLETNVPHAIRSSGPDIIFYNAGTDILDGDPLGKMNITDNGIVKRDEIVFKAAMDAKIPIVMVLSGGYTKRSGFVIGRSVTNLLKTVLPR